MFAFNQNKILDFGCSHDFPDLFVFLGNVFFCCFFSFFFPMMGKLLVLRNVCFPVLFPSFWTNVLHISDQKWHMPSSRKEMCAVAGYCGSCQCLLGELILQMSKNEHLLAAKTNPQFSEGLDLHSDFRMHSDIPRMRVFLLPLPTLYRGNQRKATERRVLFHVQRYVGAVGCVIIGVHIQKTNISPAP